MPKRCNYIFERKQDRVRRLEKSLSPKPSKAEECKKVEREKEAITVKKEEHSNDISNYMKYPVSKVKEEPPVLNYKSLPVEYPHIYQRSMYQQIYPNLHNSSQFGGMFRPFYWPYPHSY